MDSHSISQSEHGDSEELVTSSKSITRAARMNEHMMSAIQKALQQDPEIDILSSFPSYYSARLNRTKESSNLDTPVVNLNRRTLENMQNEFAKDPRIDLQLALQQSYARKFAEFSQTTAPVVEESKSDDRPRRDIRMRLDLNDTAVIYSQLSDKVSNLLSGYSKNSADSSTPSHSLTTAVIKLLWDSTVLYSFLSVRMVLKCSKEIVAKIKNAGETTEYSALHYLAAHAPHIPVPRVHGFIRLGSLDILFMSYIPSVTLRDAWPKLNYEDKLAIKKELNSILSRLRSLRQEDGHPFGGVGGEGIKDSRMTDRRSDKAINESAEFEDFQFSNPGYGSQSYIQLLRGLLPPPATGSVFTHGDIRPANILVKQEGKGQWFVTGIVDWEDSGFYPEYFECTKVTWNLSTSQEDDWYCFLPECISPGQFPVRWLVDRLWNPYVQWS